MALFESGTDLRTEGIYTLPDSVKLPKGVTRRVYPSVTSVIDLLTNFVHVERWWIADYVHQLAEALYEKREVPYWLERKGEKGETVHVNPGHILLNRLPEDYGTNAAKHWVKAAGAREMSRRANRGTIVHEAAQDWLLHEMRVKKSELDDYVKMLLEAKGFALPIDYVAPRVWNILVWLDRHVEDVELVECPCFNFEYGWAGTRDYVGRLRGVTTDGQDLSGTRWGLDWKSSDEPKPAHALQAAAYDASPHVLVRGLDILTEVEPVDRLANLYVAEDGVKLYEWFQGKPEKRTDAVSAFIYGLMAFYWFDGNGSESRRLPEYCIKRPTAEVVESFRTRQGGALCLS